MDISGHPESLRIFIAITLPANLIEALTQLQRGLETRIPGERVRWTRPEQLHLTLQFLGKVTTDRINELKAAMSRAVNGVSPFRLELKAIGCFPNARAPRVIWIDVGGETAVLAGIQSRIASATAEFGDHSEQRAFQAHLTIGRVRAAAHTRDVSDVVSRTRVGTLGSWTVSEVHLMRSELSPRGARYTTLFSAGLPPHPNDGAP